MVNSSTNITSFQEQNWKSFLRKDLIELLKECGLVDTQEKVTIEYEVSNLEELQELDEKFMDNIRHSETYSKPLKVKVKVQSNKIDTSLTETSGAIADMERELTIMHIPILTNLGFIVDGKRYEIVSRFKKALGWYILNNKGKAVLELNTKYGGKLSIGLNNNKLKISMIRKNGTKNESTSIALEVFLKAISPMLGNEAGLTYENILNKIGHNVNVFANNFYAEEELTVQQAQIKVVQSLMSSKFNGSSDEAKSLIQNRFFNPQSLTMGKESITRFKEFNSLNQLLGLELAKDAGTFKEGEILNKTKIHLLEEQGVKEVFFRNKEGKVLRINIYEPKPNLTAEEIYAAVQMYGLLSEGVGHYDDPDSLENKVLEPLSIKFGNQIQNNLRELNKHIVKRLKNNTGLEKALSITSEGTLAGMEGINAKVFNPYKLVELVRQDNEVQISEETNVMARVSKGFKITMATSNVGREARDIKPNQKGRICPIETAEGKSIGRTVTLTAMSSIDEAGFITTPYYRVIDGEVVGEPVYLNAIQEKDMNIASFHVDLSKEFADVTVNGEVKQVYTKDINLKMVSPMQVISPAAAMIPGIDNDHSRRALMATAMQRQATTPIRPERSNVTTGVESILNAGIVTAKDIILDACSTNALTAEQVKIVLAEAEVQLASTTKGDSSRKYVFKVKHELITYEQVIQNMPSFQDTMKHTSINYKVNGKGPWSLNDIVLYSHDVDISNQAVSGDAQYGDNYKISKEDMERQSVALGKNMKVLFKFHEGSGFEDAIVINRDFVDRKEMSIVYLSTYEYEIKEDNNKIDFYKFTNDISEVDRESVKHLDETGIPKIGTYMTPGQIVIGVNGVITKITKANEKTTDSRNKSVVVGHEDAGYVVDSYITKNKAVVTLGCIQDLQEGDKIAGRHGNKGVIARIVPKEDMPYLEDGTVPDIILSPLGVPSRMNIGQLVEALAGWIADKTGQIQVLESFTGNNVNTLTEKAKGLGLQPVDVYDGRTGNKFPRKMMYGTMYILRLEHRVTSKMHAINQTGGNINVKTLQPKSGKKMNGGQKIGELLSWSLLSHGADRIVDDFFSLHADDLEGKEQLRRQIMQSAENISLESYSESQDLIMAYLRAFGINLTADEQGAKVKPMSQQDIINLSDGRVISVDDISLESNNIIRKLHDEQIFGEQTTRGVQGTLELRKKYARIDLPCEVVMPIWIDNQSWANNFVLYTPKKLTASERRKYNEGSELKFRVYENEQGGLMRINNSTFKMSTEKFKSIILEEAGILPVYEDGSFMYVTMKESRSSKGENVTGTMQTLPEDMKAKVVTGMEAVLKLVREYSGYPNILDLKNAIENSNKKKSSKQMATLQNEYKSALAFNGYKEVIEGTSVKLQKDETVNREDYIVKSILVVPVGFRPADVTGQTNRISPFDSYYKGIIFAVTNLEKDNSKSKRINLWEAMYRAVKSEDGNKDTADRSLLKEFTNHKNKNSVLRDHTLGKRVEFSGRSAIIPNPNLKLGQCGVPYAMAFKLWQHHLATIVREESKTVPDLTHKEAMKLVEMIASRNVEGFRIKFNGGKTDELETTFNRVEQELKQLLSDFVKDAPVILNREPSLHKFSAQAFLPILTEGLSIQLHPLVCKGFNADFDGDQMGIFVPQTREAQEVAMDKMMVDNNIVNPGDGSIILSAEQDMILGCYTATMFYENKLELEQEQMIPKMFTNNTEDIYKQIDLGELQLQDWITFNCEGKIYYSTAGRVLFNSLLPNNSGFTDERNTEQTGVKYQLKYDTLIKKGILRDVSDYILAEHGDKELLTYLDKVKDFGFWASDLSGVSIHMFDLEPEEGQTSLEEQVAMQEKEVAIINNMYKEGFISENERKSQNVNMWTQFHASIKDSILNSLGRNNNLFIIIDSGSRGNKSQLMETLGMLGNIEGLNGELYETPIKNNFAKGLNIDDYFVSAIPARKNSVAQALETADVGELTRNIVLLLQGLQIVETDFKQITLKDGKTNIMGCESEGRIVYMDYKLDSEAISIQGDDENYNALKHTLTAGNMITDKTYELAYKTGITGFKTSTGIVPIKMKLQEISKKILEKRYTEDDLPYLHEGTITKKTLKYIEDNNIKEVHIHTSMDCVATDGICQRCYGVNYENNKYPEIGDKIGFKSAQAIGEPSSQLTLDSIHRTNSGNQRSGVEVVKQLVNLTGQNVDEVSDTMYNISMFEVFSDVAGKVQITDRDKDSVYVTVTPEDMTEVPMKFVAYKDTLKVSEGDYVDEGTSLTYGQTNYKHLANTTDIKVVQQKMVEDYANTYIANNLTLYGRHFELLVKVQTQFVKVLDQKESDLTRYEICKFQKVWEVNKHLMEEKDEPRRVEYTFMISGKNAILEQESDFVTSIGEGYLKRRIALAVLDGKVDSGKSPISKMTLGGKAENSNGFRTINIKETTKDVITVEEVKEDKKQEEDLFKPIELDVVSTDDDFNFEFDLDEEMGGDLQSAGSLEFDLDTGIFDVDIKGSGSKTYILTEEEK